MEKFNELSDEEIQKLTDTERTEYLKKMNEYSDKLIQRNEILTIIELKKEEFFKKTNPDIKEYFDIIFEYESAKLIDKDNYYFYFSEILFIVDVNMNTSLVTIENIDEIEYLFDKFIKKSIELANNIEEKEEIRKAYIDIKPHIRSVIENKRRSSKLIREEITLRLCENCLSIFPMMTSSDIANCPFCRNTLISIGNTSTISDKKESKKKKNVLAVVIALAIVWSLLFGINAIVQNANKQSEKYGIERAKERLENNKNNEINNNLNSDTRPYAIMINNNHTSWPQCGLQDAYLVYEIIYGGITRMMALYKDVNTIKIGSVRDTTDYFIDYANENDAILIRFNDGFTKSTITKLNSIDCIDNEKDEDSVLFKDATLNRVYEHSFFTSIENLQKYANEKGYNIKTNKESLLNYSTTELDLSEEQNAITANNINIKYSDYQTTSYEYDSINKVYKRSMSNTPNIDLITGEQYTVKNILAYGVKNYSIDDYGTQKIENIGTGTGYYITNGYAIPIIWEKKSDVEQTIYRYENGKEIAINKGNTFIQIYPEKYDINIL